MIKDNSIGLKRLIIELLILILTNSSKSNTTLADTANDLSTSIDRYFLFLASWISTGVPVRWKRGNPQLRRPSHSGTFAWFAQKTGKQGSISMDVSAIFYLVNSISFSLSHIDDVQIFIRSLFPRYHAILVRSLPSIFLCSFFPLSFFYFPFFFILVLVVDVEESIFFPSVFIIDFPPIVRICEKKSNFCGNINFCKISVIDEWNSETNSI